MIKYQIFLSSCFDPNMQKTKNCFAGTSLLVLMSKAVVMEQLLLSPILSMEFQMV